VKRPVGKLERAGQAPGRLPGSLLLALNEPSEEFFGLCHTLDLPISRVECQRRTQAHPRTFFGLGRLREILDATGPEIDQVLVDAALTPAQHCTLERLSRRRVQDRIDIILGIFVQHAHTPEAAAQVTIASLRRELPLIRERLHQIKSGERAGFLAGGTYVTDAYYEQARRRLRGQEQLLERIRRQRALRRKRRAELRTAALVGYTNSGKTSLLNALTGSDAAVDDRLFSTLSPTVRQLPRSRPPLLISDTVGFLQDLPPTVVSAFRATLEEALQADQLLVVADVSDAPEVLEGKLQAVHVAISDAGAYDTLWVVGAKCDTLHGSRKGAEVTLRQAFPRSRLFWASTVTGEGLEELRRGLLEPPSDLLTVEFELPGHAEAGSFLSWLYTHAYVDGGVTVDPTRLVARLSAPVLQQARHRLRSVGGILRILDLVPKNEHPGTDIQAGLQRN